MTRKITHFLGHILKPVPSTMKAQRPIDAEMEAIRQDVSKATININIAILCVTLILDKIVSKTHARKYVSCLLYGTHDGVYE